MAFNLLTLIKGMLWSFLLFLVSLHVLQMDVSSLLAMPIDYMHYKCLSFLPHTQFPQVYEALVCGQRIDDLNLRSVFVTTGLLHIFVVSGMHLSFLSRLFSMMKIPFILQAILLAVYALATSLHPPVVRAWFSLIMRFVKIRFALHWNHTLSVWYTSFAALLFFAPWYNSFSFLLSWSASLALALSKDRNLLARNLIVYFVMAPLLGSISYPHPISIFVNTLFLPLFGLFFFPLTLLSVLFSPLVVVVDYAWSFLLQFLSVIAGQLPLFKPESYLNLQQGFLYLLCLHFFICIYVSFVQQNIKKARVL